MPPKQRNNRSRGRMSKYVTKTALRHELRGQLLRTPHDPPRVILRPWHNQVLVLTGTGSKTIINSTIASGILAQEGIALATNNELVFRLRDARVWIELGVDSTNVPRPLHSPLNVVFRTIVGEGDASQDADVGGDVSYASLGFRWPISDQNATITAGHVDHFMVITPVSTTATWIIYLNLIWTTQEHVPDTIHEPLDGASAIIKNYAALKISGATPKQ